MSEKCYNVDWLQKGKLLRKWNGTGALWSKFTYCSPMSSKMQVKVFFLLWKYGFPQSIVPWKVIDRFLLGYGIWNVKDSIIWNNLIFGKTLYASELLPLWCWVVWFGCGWMASVCWFMALYHRLVPALCF